MNEALLNPSEIFGKIEDDARNMQDKLNELDVDDDEKQERAAEFVSKLDIRCKELGIMGSMAITSGQVWVPEQDINGNYLVERCIQTEEPKTGIFQGYTSYFERDPLFRYNRLIFARFIFLGQTGVIRTKTSNAQYSFHMSAPLETSRIALSSVTTESSNTVRIAHKLSESDAIRAQLDYFRKPDISTVDYRGLHALFQETVLDNLNLENDGYYVSQYIDYLDTIVPIKDKPLEIVCQGAILDWEDGPEMLIAYDADVFRIQGKCLGFEVNPLVSDENHTIEPGLALVILNSDDAYLHIPLDGIKTVQISEKVADGTA